MYEAVIFMACNLVTLIQSINPISDTIAATAQAINNPGRAWLAWLIALISMVAISATVNIFHRASEAEPSENMEVKI
jgi:hypothetical protein